MEYPVQQAGYYSHIAKQLERHLSRERFMVHFEVGQNDHILHKAVELDAVCENEGEIYDCRIISRRVTHSGNERVIWIQALWAE